MKIILACGGTGGHIFPAFSVAEEIRRRDPSVRIIYVCGRKDIETAIFKIVSGETVVSIESAAYRGFRSLLSPSFLIKLFKGFGIAFKLIVNEKPDLVAGFGGHFSFPMALIARFLGVPTLIHEQNVIPGKANRVLCKFVNAIALSFPETQDYLGLKKNFRVTGNPIRSAIEKDCRNEALEFFHFSPEKRTLLVLGGSQGAESINILFLGALKLLPDAFREKIQVLHLCGKMAITTTEEALSKVGISGRAYSFFERMDLVYGVTDLALGRAGATFLAEIDAKQIPAILVPYPLADGHQLVNAKIFCRNHDAMIAEQKDLTSENLAEVLEQFLTRLSKKDRSAVISANRKNSRGLLADYMMDIAGKK